MTSRKRKAEKPADEGKAKRRKKEPKTEEQKQQDLANAKRLRDHKGTVERAQTLNAETKTRGRVLVAKQVHYRDKTPGVDKRFPLVEGFMNVSVCSGSKTWKALSPMLLGPIVEHKETVDGTDGGVQLPPATNLENLWQGSKVWKDEVDEDGKIGKSYFERRQFLFSKVKGQRHARPKKAASSATNRNVAAFSLWQGQRLGYVAARKAIYVPLYKKYAAATEEFKKLEQLLEEGYNIQILGYDGYALDMTEQGMRTALDDGSRPFGHELVVAAMLARIDLGV